MDLDPRNGEVAAALGEVYLQTHRYNEFEQLITRAAASGALDNPTSQQYLAQMKLMQGDPVAAQSLLEQVPLDYSPGAWIWWVRFRAVWYLRDYDAANRIMAATPARWADQIFRGQPPESCDDGVVARARGDKQKALAAFAAARKRLEATGGDKPKDAANVVDVADYFRDIARLDAGLGRKEEAIREARRAVDLVPIAKDSVNGPDYVATLAEVYAWTGDRDRALEQLEIVATIPGYTSYGDLRFNPLWDELRRDERFDKIVAAAKAASR
jgi:tetratricopeptide (TPR) repeat protein